MIELLNEYNTIKILPIDSPQFRTYGRVIKGYPTEHLVRYLKEYTQIPLQGNRYVASDSGMEVLPLYKLFSYNFYGNMPIQMGYCNGTNSYLNCFEYHKGSEINVTADPVVLILAHLNDISENHLDTNCAKAFYLPAGTAVELFSTTLHFAPCKLSDSGFRVAVILPRGTNFPLERPMTSYTQEEDLLWMTNKWLISCPETIPASKGAFVGITGENIKINYPQQKQ